MSIGRNCVSMEINFRIQLHVLAFLYNACNDCNLNGMSEQRQDVNQAFREELLGWHFAVREWCCRGKKNLKGKIELSKHDFPLSATGRYL